MKCIRHCVNNFSSHVNKTYLLQVKITSNEFPGLIRECCKCLLAKFMLIVNPHSIFFLFKFMNVISAAILAIIGPPIQLVEPLNSNYENEKCGLITVLVISSFVNKQKITFGQQ